MAETGKKTGSGHPIHTNTSVPSPVHTSDRTPEPHTDMQSFDSRGHATTHSGGEHLTDAGHKDWADEAHSPK